MSEESEVKVIKVGSRKSELALIQTKHVVSLLQTIYTKHKFKIHTMSTMGDRILNISLPKIGEKSLFTKDLEDALCNGDVDFVVHSLKDLPTQLPANLCIGAVLEREDPRDALVLNRKYEGSTLSTLPANSIIGTSSLRRTAQLKNLYPQLIVEDIRGNLNTRLAKLDDTNSKYAGIILAQAGLVRMGWQHRISQTLDPNTTLLYAVGQGALAVECCVNNVEILNMLKNLISLHTQCQVLIERSFLKKLGGGCSAPVGINTLFKKLPSNKNTTTALNQTQDNDELSYTVDVNGGVWSLDGQQEVLCKVTSTIALKSDINTTNVIKSLQRATDSVDDGELISINKKKIKLNVNEELQSNEIMDFMKVHQNVFKDETITIDNHERATPIKKQCPMKMTSIGNEEMAKCPFLRKNTLSTDDNQLINDPSTGVKCPLNLGIGEDIMAECPVYNVQQKIDANLQMHHHHHQNTPLSFIHPSSSVDIISIMKDNKTVESGDTNRNDRKGGDQHQLKDEHSELDEDKIFCGIYHHNCYDVNLLKKCVNLGCKLANDLIEKGALTIMKSAQNEIRSKD